MAAANGSILVHGYDVASDFVLVVDASGQVYPITVPETKDALPLTSGMVADAIGWWLGSQDGLYLRTPSTGAVLISEVLAAPTGACA
jgi:hypothetical protein